jgi:NAD(P)H-nitrite reductase large subunit
MSSALPTSLSFDTPCSLTETDEVVCHCLQIRRSEVKTAAGTQEATSVRRIMKATDAGTGCTACHSRIRQLLAEYAEETRTASSQFEQA